MSVIVIQTADGWVIDERSVFGGDKKARLVYNIQTLTTI